MGSGSTLAGSPRLRLRFAAGMLGANLVGAVVVFVFARWILPLPPVDDPARVQRANLLVFGAYLLVAVPLGALVGVRLFAPVLRWLRTERVPTADEQRLALRAPLRQLGVHAALWLLAAVVFVALDLHWSSRLALVVAVTVVLGGAATCALGYLLGERILRPVAALALAADVPEDVAIPGVATRVLLAWALGTGVPVLGTTLVGGGQLIGVLSASGDRLAGTALYLGAVALVVGLVAMTLTARSIADPLEQVRHALARVRGGRLDTEVAVYDGSEVGLLQAGFNRMAAGLREREALRDLFGRHVGEDVAREALARGTTLGGELREVAVLFVDLVGSTELAARRPPDEVVETLNAFFRVVVAAVAAEGGSINKFVGDAALAIFRCGPPGSTGPDTPGSSGALAAARAIVRHLRADLPATDFGIGIAAGPAVAGNIGAAERFEYTVIGDPVNEAARLTELAKREPGRLLASGDAIAGASEQEAAHWALGEPVTLRGRVRPTRLARAAPQ